jgi:hypothetical protein
MVKPLTKAEIITSGDIGNLSTSLINKQFVHSLPTQLLLRSHNQIELQHLKNPQDKRLQIAHTNLFLEMELREIEHFDTDPNFFTPSNTKWPFELEFDEEFRIERFKKKIKKINNNKKTPTSPKDKTPKQKRFKKLDDSRKIKIRRGSRKKRGRRRLFKENELISKTTKRKTTNRGHLLERHSGIIEFTIPSEETKRIFTLAAENVWDIQPDTGNVPIANGPRPKKEHWYKNLFTMIFIGAYQAFMQKTLIAFYRRQVPPWAIQEWDIQLTATDAFSNSQTVEKRNFIQTQIDPN